MVKCFLHNRRPKSCTDSYSEQVHDKHQIWPQNRIPPFTWTVPTRAVKALIQFQKDNTTHHFLKFVIVYSTGRGRNHEESDPFPVLHFIKKKTPPKGFTLFTYRIFVSNVRRRRTIWMQCKLLILEIKTPPLAKNNLMYMPELKHIFSNA